MGKCRDRAATIHANNDSGSVGMNIKRISRCAGSQTRQSANLRHPPLSASLPAAFVNDPYGSHGGNWSAYGGNFVLDTFHYVSVASLYVQGQLVGGEFHSDFFGPLGYLTFVFGGPLMGVRGAPALTVFFCFELAGYAES